MNYCFFFINIYFFGRGFCPKGFIVDKKPQAIRLSKAIFTRSAVIQSFRYYDMYKQANGKHKRRNRELEIFIFGLNF